MDSGDRYLNRWPETPPMPPSGLSRLAVSLSNRLDERERTEDVDERGPL